MRGVTQYTGLKDKNGRISTHTPHARRDSETALSYIGYIISTHTPHARRDVLG